MTQSSLVWAVQKIRLKSMRQPQAQRQSVYFHVGKVTKDKLGALLPIFGR